MTLPDVFHEDVVVCLEQVVDLGEWMRSALGTACNMLFCCIGTVMARFTDPTMHAMVALGLDSRRMRSYGSLFLP